MGILLFKYIKLMGDVGADEKKIKELDKIVKECVEYDNKTRNESLLGAP